MNASIETLVAVGELSALDVEFARAVTRIGGDERPEVALVAALASRSVAAGHVCLDLPRHCATPIAAVAGTGSKVTWPRPGPWLKALRRSPLCVTAGHAAESTAPLIVDDSGRVYLRRYWEHEFRVLEAIRARLARRVPASDISVLRASLDRLFPRVPGVEGPDRQRWAAAVAALRPFCVISGGPGTGKTFTVVKILALLIEQELRSTGRTPRILLMAPTGKAAARLREAIQSARGQLSCPPEVASAIPDEAATIHRALGAFGDGSGFRYHGGNPLFTDIVLVDEASMVDLALMSRLFDALPASARVILLGDRDQLASVEAGAVLGDISNAGTESTFSPECARELSALTGDAVPAGPGDGAAIRDCVVELTHSYRYAAARGIGALARAINGGRADEALAVLRGGNDVRLAEPGQDGALGRDLVGAVREGYGPALRADEVEARLTAFDRFRVLAAHRHGPGGVEEINRHIEAVLESAGLITRDQETYLGRPLLVTQNDYEVRLFNGDVGIVCAVGPTAERRVVFAAGDCTLRVLSAARLPPHETVFAMTVHKSQGSEFDEVAVVLPPRPSPVVTRELLYTAVTRAKRQVTVYATPDAVAAAVRQRVDRTSGLRDALWGPPRRLRRPGVRD